PDGHLGRRRSSDIRAEGARRLGLESLAVGRSAIMQISVVIPALDAEQYLPELLRGIEAQTLSPDEIVIVDSSPSGRTADLVESWMGQIPIVFKRVNFAYPGHARNIGVE